MTVVTLVARSKNEAMVAPMAESGVWSQAVGFVLLRLGGSRFSCREDFFSLL
jgi:hypothetical protein